MNLTKEEKELKIIRAKKGRIVKFYNAAKSDRMSIGQAKKEIELICKGEKNTEILEHKEEAFKRLRQLEEGK